MSDEPDALAGLLAVLAVPYVEDRVRVHWREPDAEPVARVTWGGGGWDVEIARGLGSGLAHAFHHELAHIVLGHVARGAVPAGVLRMRSAFRGIARDVDAEHERAADAWARDRVTGLDRSVRWLLDTLAR